MTAALLDSNVVIRFLVVNNRVQSEAAWKLFSRTDVQLVLPDTVLAEVVWTLSSHYKVERKILARQLRLLLETPSLKGNLRLLDAALELFGSRSIDYVDAYLAALSLHEKIPVYSWDKDFDKLKGVTRLQP
ncbi:MAG: PIN domain-containing protein [bacterium]